MNIPDDALYALLRPALAARGSETLQRMLYLTVREAILNGTLAARSRLPGSRALSSQLELSRNTVNAALEQLATEGYLHRDRRGSEVAALPPATRRDSPTMAFTPGTPAVNYFPLPLWRRLLDRTLREEGSRLLGYGDAAGEWPLRAAIARHLTLARGIRCDAGQIVITEGALEGLNLCIRLLSERGQLAWIEDPGYPGREAPLRQAGCGSRASRLMGKECVCPPLLRRSLNSFIPHRPTSSRWAA